MPTRVELERGRFALSAWLFYRVLGATALSAFVSLHVQILGLFGSEGILPLAERVARVHERLGAAAWLDRPTLLYATGAGDAQLVALCAAGEIAAVSLLVGVLTGPAALACFVAYASFVNVGAPFLPLQWDTLLCETLLLATIAAPWRDLVSTPARAREPARPALWALWFLIARLMLASGLVKLLGGDPTWRDLTALSYHYWTQPLPTPASPYAHALPMFVHRVGALFTFVVELLVPPLVFAPSRWRHVAAALFIALQISIALTGNYGFFNLLTIALCIPLFDDASLLRTLPRGARQRLRTSLGPMSGGSPRLRTAPGGSPGLRWPAAWIAPGLLASAVSVLGFVHFATSVGFPARGAVYDLLVSTERLRVASAYGLFADMTTERPVLVVEGSLDGRTWVGYPLRYGPTDPGAGLAFLDPHMPRLDWMLWFAALDSGDGATQDELWRGTPWLAHLERALLERRPDAIALFARDPFDGRPPRFVRMTKWDYRFAPLGRRATWARSDPRPFGPVLRRRDE